MNRAAVCCSELGKTVRPSSIYNAVNTRLNHWRHLQPLCRNFSTNIDGTDRSGIEKLHVSYLGQHYQLAFRLFPLDCLAFCGNPRPYFPFYKDHNINRSASSNFYFSSRVSTMASFLSHLSPVPTFPAYTGPYKVGTQDVEIPIPELSSPSLAPDPSISTVSFRISYPCEPGRHAKPVYWLPSPQTQVFRAYARFMSASPRLAAFLS